MESALAKDKFQMFFIGVISVVVILAVAFLLLVPRSAGTSPGIILSLPKLNAMLNAVSALLLSCGYIFIRRKKRDLHKTCMLLAFGVSSLFLVSYVIYHYYSGSKKFEGIGWIRPVYFFILITHITLATTVVPLALTGILRGLKGEFTRHKKITRWTLPIWLYVSVTGVVVYMMLYHLH